MKYIYLYLILSFCLAFSVQAGKANKKMVCSVQKINPAKKIIIEVQGMPVAYYKNELLPNAGFGAVGIEDSLTLKAIPISHRKHLRNTWPEYKSKILDRNARWEWQSNESSIVHISDKLGMLVNPGDSIHISFKANEPVFSGRGVEKIHLRYEIDRAIEKLNDTHQLPKNAFLVNTLKEYLNWNNYADKAVLAIDAILMAYANKLDPGTYRYIKSQELENVESERLQAFVALQHKVLKDKGLGVNNNDLNAVFDSTLNKPAARWLRSITDLPIEQSGYVQQALLRKYNFDLSNELINTAEKRDALHYEMSKHDFKGLVREMMLAHIITERIIKWDKQDPKREALLNDYYSLPGFPEYKKDVKNFELWRNSRGQMVKGRKSADFVLYDAKGKAWTKEDLKDKIVLMNFWQSGNKDCAVMATALRRVEKTFEKDPGVMFVHVSADKDKATWLKSLAEKKYTTGNGLQLRVGEKLSDFPMLKAYNVTSFPKLHILDVLGRNVDTGLDSVNNVSELVIKEIKGQQILMQDGPYVLDKGNAVYAYFVKGNVVSDQLLNKQRTDRLNVQTDQPGKTFQIVLKQKLEIAPAVYPKAPKLFCLSDIEGNFDKFRKLLQANNIIDAHYNWIFGDGHLVFSGDMFDRGTQVTECLWLVYMLEAKAEAAGGYLHFIMGNHEIMNLSNDIRYVHEKYIANAKLMGMDYVSLYDHHSELGRWLRTKNVMEKIGDLLFLHAGVSPKLNRLPIGIEGINQLSRKYYAGNLDTTDQVLMTLFDGKTSPFWFRGYYAESGSKIKEIPGKVQMDSVFKKFGIKRIVTGHTIVRDTISVWYGNKVINTDVKHKDGKSEALLIDGADYYRVNGEGKRVLLFRDEEK